MDRSGCASHDGESTFRKLLRRAGLRPTRQRVALATLLFGNGDRHVTAEMLHEEAVRAGERVSLATVYNTLHQFKRAGLLREIAIGGQRAYFDTNTSNHNHFFVEAEGSWSTSPATRSGSTACRSRRSDLKISHIDVVVRPGAQVAASCARRCRPSGAYALAYLITSPW